MSVARRAALISFTCISSENRSSASSIADASKCRTTDVSSAVRFGSGVRSRIGAFDPSPTRASVASRFGGTLSTFTRPRWNAEISSTRSRAFAMPVPVVRVGGRRSRSSSETLRPSGTPSSATRSAGNDASARRTAPATVAYSRFSAIERTAATCLASTETPGSSTRLRRSHPTAWLNSATGASAPVHDRPCRNVRTSGPLRILERVVAVGVPDLPRVLVRRLRPLGVPLHARRVLDPQLRGQVLDHRPRHVQRIVHQEPADIPHGAHLHREPQLVSLRPPRRAQVPVHVVQEEEPLQLRACGLLGELPVRLGLYLYVGQKCQGRSPRGIGEVSQPRG